MLWGKLKGTQCSEPVKSRVPSIWFIQKIWDFLVAQEQKLGARGHWDLLEHSPVCIFKLNFHNKRKEVCISRQGQPLPHVHSKTRILSPQLLENAHLLSSSELKHRQATLKPVSHWNSDLGRNARVCKYNKNMLVYYLLSLPLRQ